MQRTKLSAKKNTGDEARQERKRQRGKRPERKPRGQRDRTRPGRRRITKSKRYRAR